MHERSKRSDGDAAHYQKKMRTWCSKRSNSLALQSSLLLFKTLQAAHFLLCRTSSVTCSQHRRHHQLPRFDFISNVRSLSVGLKRSPILVRIEPTGKDNITSMLLMKILSLNSLGTVCPLAFCLIWRPVCSLQSESSPSS